MWDFPFAPFNAKSIDLAILKPDKVRFIKIDISEAKYIRDRYFRKRRNIQGKASRKTKAKLLVKYSGREKRLSQHILRACETHLSLTRSKLIPIHILNLGKFDILPLLFVWVVVKCPAKN